MLASSDKLALLSPSKVLLRNCQMLGLWALQTAQLFHEFASLQVNLFLRVVRRREDGYHDLASLFHVSTAALVQWVAS